MTKTQWRRGLGVVVLGFFLRLPVFAQQTETSHREEPDAYKKDQEAVPKQAEIMREIEELKKGQEDIRKQIGENMRLLRQQPAPGAAAPNVKDVVLDLGKHPIKGRKGAKLTLVEFADYQCPYCARYVRETYPQIEQRYIETGKLRYAKLDFPLESVHNLAYKAALATQCAEEQGKFWEMHRRLFQNHGTLEPLSAHAEAIGIDLAKFNACVSAEKYAAAVRRDIAEAEKVGINSTPSFILAKTDPNDPSKVRGIRFILGALPFNDFKSAIDQALQGPEQ